MSGVKLKDVSGVSINRLVLWLDNPRIGPHSKESEVAAVLIDIADVMPLARDIATLRSLNPMDRTGVVAISGPKPNGQRTFVVYEGNRRICALKILQDPLLAPKKFQKELQTLQKSMGEDLITAVNVVEFPDYESIEPWIERFHDTGPRSRLRWDAEARSRHFNDEKYRLAIWVLDDLAVRSLATVHQKKKKLSVFERFLANKRMRETLSLTEQGGVIRYGLPEDALVPMLQQFANDLLNGVKFHGLPINTRYNKPEIEKYAEFLASKYLQDDEKEDSDSPVPESDEGGDQPEEWQSGSDSAEENSDVSQAENEAGQSQEETPPEQNTSEGDANSLGTANSQQQATATNNTVGAKPPRIPPNLSGTNLIEAELRRIGSVKLDSLYYSLMKIQISNHVVLLSIGLWAFLETMTALMGRLENDNFESFLAQKKTLIAPDQGTKSWGATKDALSRVRKAGNTGKHHPVGGQFSKEALYSDWTILRPIIERALTSIPSHT